MTDTILMTAAVAKNPTDLIAQGALADLIAETTGDYGEAVATAKSVAGKTLARREAARVRRLFRGTSVAAVEAMLATANGRRRERTLSLSEVIECVARVRKNRLTWRAIGGGFVANAYRYPASQTVCLVAVRTDGTIRVTIGTAGARKGSSLTRPLSGLAVNASADQYRAWADAGN